eukprot:3907894-Alexandrium_andersonii.AAC.1
MSASLVGSEMCIRDRCWGVLRGCFRRRAEGDLWALQRALFGHSVGALGSVSYTHLTLPTICSV